MSDNFFVSKPKAFARVATAKAKGPKAFEAALGGLVECDVFESVKLAGEAFNSAVAEATAALVRQRTTDATEAANKLLSGVTLSKTLVAKLAGAFEAATVLDDETGEVLTAPTGILVALNDEGQLTLSVLRKSLPSGNGSNRGSVTDYLLDGEQLSNALLKTDKYKDTVAGKVARNGMKPYGVAELAGKARGGKDYGEKTAWNALQAVNADPVLKSRLTKKS